MGLKSGRLRSGLRNISTAVGEDAIPDSGVLRYEFEQDVTDSWNNNDATDNTSAGYTTNAPVGSYAKVLDGTDDYLTFPSGLLSPTADWTISFWINANTLGSDDRIVSPRADLDNLIINIGRAGTDTLGFRNVDTEYAVSTISADTWYMFTLTYSETDTEFNAYLNDTLENTVQDSTASGSETNAIGTDAGNLGSTKFYDGDIDDKRIYDKELTSTEVSNLYNTGSISG